jgi:fluoroquinolone transport system permease protein
MNRLLTTIRWDVTLQMRNGFYLATAFVTIVWALILAQAGALDLRWLVPPMLVGNLLLGTFYFIGGLVLLERGEGTLTAQVVTPLRIGEYLAAKVVTLTALALVETLVLVPLLVGWDFNVLLLGAGVILAAALYCLAGFIAVARYTAINEYLLPSGAVVAALWVPLGADLVQWRPALLYLHPLSAPLALIEAALGPASPEQVLYGLGYSALWIALLAWGSRRAFRRWMIARGAGAAPW